jgi:hypothetical protein
VALASTGRTFTTPFRTAVGWRRRLQSPAERQPSGVWWSTVTKDDIEGGVRVGVITTGIVTNPSATTLPGYDIGAFYFDGRGRFLGYSALNPGNLRAHETMDFGTIPLAGPAFDRAAIAKIEVFPASRCDICQG